MIPLKLSSVVGYQVNNTPLLTHSISLSLSLSLSLLQSLTKPPTDYPDKKSLAHVQVALRMQSRNVHVQAGDVIPYVVCKVSSKYNLQYINTELIISYSHMYEF